MLDQLFRRIAPLAAIALGASLAGCSDMDISINGQEGVPLSELDMSGPAPDEIVVASGDTVIITEGDALAISVEADDETASKLRFVRDGQMLGVSREGSSWGDSSPATIRVTMALPRELVIGGSGVIETPGVASNAEVVIGGSGTMRLGTIAVEKLEVSIGGAGEVSAAGTAKSLEISIGGSGDAKFSELTADDVEISIGGSGNVTLRSDGTVDASIGGSGDINVTGNAKCTLSSFGSGTLNCNPASGGDAPAAADAEDAPTG